MRKYLLLIIFVFSLISCDVRNRQIETPPAITATQILNAEQEECLPPLENSSFLPSGGERLGPKLFTPKLPVQGWVSESPVPDGKPITGSEVAQMMFSATQHIGEKEYAWVWIGIVHTKLVRYEIGSNQWSEVKKPELDLLSEPTLFIDKNNSVWMARKSRLSPNLNQDTPILNVYNEDQQKFDITLRVSDFLNLHTSGKMVGVGIDTIKADSKGTLWFVLQVQTDDSNSQYALYTFVPSSHQLERRLPNWDYSSSNRASFVISPDDTLYLLDEKNNSIIHYDITKNAVENINIPSQVANNTNTPTQGLVYSSSELFLDNKKRLWVADRGWLDLSPTGDWHIVIRSPIFIVYINGAGMWNWEHPLFLNESDDGRLWYVSYNRGTGWVDPEKGKWCLFTTYPSNITKDSKGNLWMVANGELYKYTVIP